MAKKAKIVRLEDLERLAALQCTAVEAAGFFGISHRAFNKLLKEDEDVRNTWESGRQCGKIALRRKQFKLASNSATMAIHLGKVWLGQKEAISVEHTGKDGGPIENVDLTKLSGDERKQLRDIITRAHRPSQDIG